MSEVESFHTVVVGGGQAGLAAAYFLKQAGIDFVVLDSHPRPGEAWRRRWDSLRLFTPSQFDQLPGIPFPRSDFYFPTKDEVADYLEAYVDKFHLPVRLNTTVDSLTQTDGAYFLAAGPNRFSAKNVIVAAGAYQNPVTPSFSREINHGIVHLHSSDYKDPGQLPEGAVLVVGAGNSGSEIAIELANTGRKVWLSGRNVGRIPADTFGRLFGGRPYWLFISRVLSIDTPMGRKVRQKALHQGTPLIRLRSKDITDAGVIRCPKVSGASDGLPKLENGQILEVAGIVWATGFRPDFNWIKLPIFDQTGYPIHTRGVVTHAAGLYFVGLHFQTALSSALLGGVGTDAQYVVEEHIARSN